MEIRFDLAARERKLEKYEGDSSKLRNRRNVAIRVEKRKYCSHRELISVAIGIGMVERGE